MKKEHIHKRKEQENKQRLPEKSKMMSGRRLGDRIGMKEEVIMKACELSMKAHKSNGQVYYQSPDSSSEVVIAFAQSWSANDWFSGLIPFGESKIDLTLFPCLRSISTEDIASVNDAFARRFKTILETTWLPSQVEKAVNDGKQMVFAGHSSGGPMAILATLWFLNKYTRKCGSTTPRCVTFGSPLVGDRIFPHALRRENWARYFVHFVVKRDVVPLIMLSPFSSVERELPRVLEFFNPKSTQLTQDESVLTSSEASTFLTTVMVNASSVASHAASKLMGGTDLLVETFSSFIELSPYRPFGTFMFCNANDKLVLVENSDAVLQLLFYFSKLSNEADFAEVAYTRLNEHMVYEEVLKGGANMKDLIYLDHPEETNWALNGLGLGRKAKLCLRAAEDVEKLKKKSQESLKKDSIREGLRKMQEYQIGCERQKLWYYDSFKIQNKERDFEANVARLELTGMWDEVMVKLKIFELPDELEGQKEWIELGTQHRRLVEPLDIANYYRHGKNEDTGTYLKRGRSGLYRCTQRWLEHDERMPFEKISESCFMAEVEDIRIIGNNSFEDMKERIVSLERQILQWDQAKVLSKDVFLEKSTFSQWWNSLPDQHKSESCIRDLFCKIKGNPS